jgi:UDPglucose 6-dehydrogenase
MNSVGRFSCPKKPWAGSKPKIGIVGVGYLGGAVKYWFDKQKFDAFFYDKHKEIGSLQDLNKADIIFICLPTPFIEEGNRGFDDSAILEVLPEIKGEKIVVIRSTVLPGSTESYQQKYPQHKFLMNPEFLRAKTAIQDYLNPERQIIGYTEKSRDIATDILSILPRASFERIVRATEAELVKYFGNIFLANRVIFANQIYDLCRKIGIDYETVKECAAADPRVGSSHFEIFHDGYRGYSGACLPKDTKAFIQFAQKLGIEPKLFKTLEEINKELINGSGKE